VSGRFKPGGYNLPAFPDQVILFYNVSEQRLASHTEPEGGQGDENTNDQDNPAFHKSRIQYQDTISGPKV
jgi:hypothetical protein